MVLKTQHSLSHSPREQMQSPSTNWDELDFFKKLIKIYLLKMGEFTTTCPVGISVSLSLRNTTKGIRMTSAER